MQTKLLMGREFDARDKQDGTRVAVVNKAFVDQLMHGQDPIGKRFRTSPDGKPIQIVGVAEDGKYFSLAGNARTPPGGARRRSGTAPMPRWWPART